MKNPGKKILLASALVVLLGGCNTAQIPYTENHPLTYQKVTRSAHHWDVLADDVAAQTIASIGKEKLIHVATTPESTPFNRAFRNFLITRMVNKDIPVSTQKSGATEVQFEAQIVKHNSERRAYRRGTITTIAAGLLVARNVQHWGTDGQGLALAAAAVGLDALATDYSGDPTKTELLVTTSVTEDNRYLMRKTDVYYLEPEDATLFAETILTTFKVSGDK